MNIFWFELKSIRFSTVMWLIGLAVLLGVYLGVYPSFSRDAEATKQLFSSLPPAFGAAIGLNMETLFSFLGFLGNIFTVVLLAAAIHGSSLGLGIFSREQRSKTTDFLLSKPRHRRTVFTAKYLAGTTVIILTTTWVILVAFLVSRLLSIEGYDFKTFFMITAVFGMIEIWFFSVAVLLSQVKKKIKIVAPTALTLAFGMFLFGTIGTLIDENKTRWLAPAKYVDFSYVVEHQKYQWPYLAVGAGIVGLSLAMSYMIYTRKDAASLT